MAIFGFNYNKSRSENIQDVVNKTFIDMAQNHQKSASASIAQTIEFNNCTILSGENTTVENTGTTDLEATFDDEFVQQLDTKIMDVLKTVSTTIASDSGSSHLVEAGGMTINDATSYNLEQVFNDFTADLSVESINTCVTDVAQRIGCSNSKFIAGGNIAFTNLTNAVASCIFSTKAIQDLTLDIENLLEIESTTAAMSKGMDIMGIVIVILVFGLLGGGAYFLFMRRALSPTRTKYIVAGVGAVVTLALMSVFAVLTYLAMKEDDEGETKKIWEIPHFYITLVFAFLFFGIGAYLLMMVFMSK